MKRSNADWGCLPFTNQCTIFNIVNSIVNQCGLIIGFFMCYYYVVVKTAICWTVVAVEYLFFSECIPIYSSIVPIVSTNKGSVAWNAENNYSNKNRLRPFNARLVIRFFQQHIIMNSLLLLVLCPNRVRKYNKNWKKRSTTKKLPLTGSCQISHKVCCLLKHNKYKMNKTKFA